MLNFFKKVNLRFPSVSSDSFSNTASQSSRGICSILSSSPLSSFSSRNPIPFHNSSPLSVCSSFSPINLIFSRGKATKVQAYTRKADGSRVTQGYTHQIGVKALSAEFVNLGQTIAKQRRFVAFNMQNRKRRQFKYYPGENVRVAKDSSLVSMAYGRIKMTQDLRRRVLIMNVLPESREELLEDDLWRYRTEHVNTMEENHHLCMLRTKYSFHQPRPLVNAPVKNPRIPKRLSRFEVWENPMLKDAQYRRDVNAFEI